MHVAGVQTFPGQLKRMETMREVLHTASRSSTQIPEERPRALAPPHRTVTKQTPWPLVRKRTIPTERQPLVDEI
jgi:hypothetical protein